jgi:hypothetical protein
VTSISGMTSETDYAGYKSHADYTERMNRIQLDFIDDPRKAALDADGLASELLQACGDELAQRRKGLTAKPGDGAPDTEHLRQAVRRYRELVDTLAETMRGPDETEQAESLSHPEETTYRVGENGEAEAVDPNDRETPTEALDPAPRSGPPASAEVSEQTEQLGRP